MDCDEYKSAGQLVKGQGQGGRRNTLRTDAVLSGIFKQAAPMGYKSPFKTEFLGF